ncbi:hypothetical protein H4R99_002028 [Coemansia sp. RSA 1722]|nr:hypothetical protein LPJ57_002458 [Coemansia sp. RSA 486]KAJ2600487.1 hypothetical protein GGF39_001751 [Coemansia sp. RSA 1721]KAJ2604079.1 hypothetical protein H4R99_002028 [Coemansia sp. RSA 1722]KAJ2638063.1 hypothetical protein GGF40_001912 [Coemansia sp. RSA 1286]
MPKQKSSAASSGGGYYAVRNGRRPGIYRSWAECQAQVSGFPRAKFKKFSTEQDARGFVGQSIPTPVSPSTSAHQARSAPYSTFERAVIPPMWSLPRPQADSANIVPACDPDRSQGQQKPQKPQKQSQTHPGAEPPKAGLQSDGTVVAYTDGASTRNGMENARAGVGVYFGAGDPRNVSEPLAGSRQTNQRAELTAVIRAIEQVALSEKREQQEHEHEQELQRGAALMVATDSMYSINCLTSWFGKWERNGWVGSQGKPVENADLIKTALRLIRQRNGRVQFFHVPGHAGIEGNECADRLAVDGCNIVRDPVCGSPPPSSHLSPYMPPGMRFNAGPSDNWWSYFY